MSAADLVSRLEVTRETGPGRWICRCPAHEDRHPSLSIRELEDGTTLVHCFAGCHVQAIVEAVGLQVSDLFPERPPADVRPRSPRGFNPMDVLVALAHEATVVLISARTIAGGEALSASDVERLSVAATRINAALDLAHA